LNDGQVAVVRVADQAPGPSGWPALAFHVLAIDRRNYEAFLGDPFLVAERLPVDWAARGQLPSTAWPAAPLPGRTVAQVQAVLKRVKAFALQEGEDPEQPKERTVENSESPALLGGAQVLVDGGKLVFVRKAPDLALVQGLWMLLPASLRGKIWPASFAFSNALGFDVVVTPRLGDASWEGYTTEDQAAEYPAGSYELALQTAAEAGDQAELDQVFQRRSSGETMRLAWRILVFLGILVIVMRFLQPPPRPAFGRPERAALAAGIVAVGDPWTALAMLQEGQRRIELNKEGQR
jgi:hypothetical protein